MEKEHETTQVALIPSPGIGHLIAFIEFAKVLQSRFNFSITLLLPSRAHDKPTEAQITLLSTLPNGISYVNLPPIDLSHVPTDDLDVTISLVMLSSTSSIRDALSALPGLVAVVTDLFGTPVYDVARELGIFPYMYFTTNAMYLLFLFHLPKLHETVSCKFRDMVDPISLPGCVPIHGRDLEDALQDRTSEAYSWIFYHLKRYGLVEGIFINTFLDLEPVAIEALKTEDPNRPPIYPIGPIVRSRSGCEAHGLDCLSWLDQQPPRSVLFVSFGSGGTLTSDQLNALAIGLEKSEVRFLWVVKGPNDQSSFGSYYKDHNKDEPFGFLPIGFRERTKDRGLLLSSWAPQFEVLSHKSTGGFLTHCGWNSILESIINVVPLIAWPLYAEQKINAIILNEGLKVALRPKYNDNGIVEANEIAKVVKDLMIGEGGKRIHNQIKVLSDCAKNVVSDTGESTCSLNDAANKWILSKLCKLSRFIPPPATLL